MQQVAAFIPLPFNHDPLLLKWFDEHSELWQSLHSMNAPKASRSVQHGITDRKRMEAAQTLLQQALEAHNATVPRVLPPDASNDWSAFPPHVLGAPDASSVPIPSPAPAPSPPDKWRESKWGASPAEGGGFGGGAPSRPVSWAGAAAPPRPWPHAGLIRRSAPPDARRFASRTSASGLETSSSGGGRRPGSASSLRRATSRASARDTSPSSRALVAAPSPSNLAPEIEPPPDPAEEARLRAEARARAVDGAGAAHLRRGGALRAGAAGDVPPAGGGRQPAQARGARGDDYGGGRAT